MIWTNLIIGSFIIIVTILVHSFVTRYVLHLAKKKNNSKNKHLQRSNEFWISVMVLIMFFAGIAESAIWASVYIFLGSFN
jgi:hypothetical protein